MNRRRVPLGRARMEIESYYQSRHARLPAPGFLFARQRRAKGERRDKQIGERADGTRVSCLVIPVTRPRAPCRRDVHYRKVYGVSERLGAMALSCLSVCAHRLLTLSYVRFTSNVKRFRRVTPYYVPHELLLFAVININKSD